MLARLGLLNSSRSSIAVRPESMAKQLPVPDRPELGTQHNFDEIREPAAAKRAPWILPRSTAGWRRRFSATNVSNNIRNVAASCTMILSSFILGISCVLVYNSAWGCSPFSSCPTKCSFLIGLGVQSALLFGLSMALFWSSAWKFPINSPLSCLPSILGCTTIVTYHWVLYGTYAKIVTNVCPSARLEYAFSIVLVLGHVLLGMPSVMTGVIWQFGRASLAFEEQNLCRALDKDTAPIHERNSLLMSQLNEQHEPC